MVTARDPEMRDVLLKVRYPDSPGRDDLATEISSAQLFVATDDVTDAPADITLTLEFPGLLAPVPLTARVLSRLPANPAIGQSAGLLLAWDPPNDAERERLAELLTRLRLPALANPARPFRLLLVDDSVLAHKVVGSAVARMQRAYPTCLVELLLASSVTEARDVLGRERVDMALVDYYMPGHTGDQLVRAIRENAMHPALPVLVIVEGGRVPRDVVVRAGADLVLDKPLLLKPLLATITALVTSLPQGAPS